MSAVKAAAVQTQDGTAYADDFYTWTQEQGARLRAGDFSALDLANLAEEIESLGRSEFSGLVGAWRVILLHMLKFDYQPDKKTRSWAISIAAQRGEAADVLTDNPGLKHRLQEALERAYRGARLGASKETRLPLRCFPETCPYTLEEIRSRPFPVDPDDLTA
jgi:hypothetical protein